MRLPFDSLWMLEARFWDEFASQIWNKRPTMYNGPTIELSEAAAFDGVRAALESLAKVEPTASADSVAVLFAGKRKALQTEAIHFLPGGARNIEEYCSQVSERLGGEPFGIQIKNFEQYVPGLFAQVKSFLGPLISRVGVPFSTVETGVFLGTYEMTPFGIHKDIGNSVFTFPIFGAKRFLLWPPDRFDKDPLEIFRAPDPALYANDAVDLEVRPGEFMFWPTDWVHVGYQRERKPHLAFSVGLWCDSSVAAFVVGVVQQWLAKSGLNRRLFGEAFELPSDLPLAIQALGTAAQDGTLQRLLDATWNERLAQAGFLGPHRD